MTDTPRPILTIAGSDPGGGAGIQADIKTMTLLGGFGMSVITSLTAQNGLGVTGIHAPDAAFVRLQLETILEGFPVAAAKTGMLFSASIIEAVAGTLRFKGFPLVVDPVAVSQSGHVLLEPTAIQAIAQYMLPLADLLTPNRPEAEALAGTRIVTHADMARAAERLLDLGAKAVLIKGGHFDTGELDAQADVMTDWLCLPGNEPQAFPHARVGAAHNHGTGCSLSAAIATFLGHGFSLEKSVRLGQQYISAGLAAGFAPGKGTGPINFTVGAAAVNASLGRT